MPSVDSMGSFLSYGSGDRSNVGHGAQASYHDTRMAEAYLRNLYGPPDYWHGYGVLSGRILTFVPSLFSVQSLFAD